MIKSFRKMICVIMLILVLIPCMASAQDDDRTSSNQTFSQEELAQMMAPIALYPDALLSQVLMAAAYPFEVVEADRWMTKNSYVKSDALDEALQAKDWDVSILSLCHYPKILTMMSENLSWTARLGDAFANQEADVMDTVQELRARANAEGNLTSTEEQRVIYDERYIRIEPVRTDYISVPAYDPYVIYGAWWYPMFPPVPIIMPGLVITGPGIIFSPGFHVGGGVFGWSSFNWRERNVVIVDIERTRRFNRHFQDYKGRNERPWRPDHDRRFIREKRGGEIPRFRPPAKPLPNGQRLDRRPGNVLAPDKQRIPSDKPRLTDKDKRPDLPRLGDKAGKPEIGAPGVINRDKQPRWGQPKTDPGKSPDSGTPRIIDRDKLRKPDSGMIEKSQPMIRDRGKVEGIELRNRPVADQKGVTGPDRVRERDTKSSRRLPAPEERQDGTQRFMDREGRK